MATRSRSSLEKKRDPVADPGSACRTGKGAVRAYAALCADASSAHVSRPRPGHRYQKGRTGPPGARFFRAPLEAILAQFNEPLSKIVRRGRRRAGTGREGRNAPSADPAGQETKIVDHPCASQGRKKGRDTAVPIRGMIQGMAVHFAVASQADGDRHRRDSHKRQRASQSHTSDCDTRESFAQEPERCSRLPGAVRTRPAMSAAQVTNRHETGQSLASRQQRRQARRQYHQSEDHQPMTDS